MSKTVGIGHQDFEQICEDAFGFTEEEVFAALDEFGLSDKSGEIKKCLKIRCFRHFFFLAAT